MAVACAKCGCEQITAQRRGVNIPASLIGGVVAGPLGLAAGAPGSNDVVVTCLQCGHQWTPGPRRMSFGLRYLIAFSVLGVIVFAIAVISQTR